MGEYLYFQISRLVKSKLREIYLYFPSISPNEVPELNTSISKSKADGSNILSLSLHIQ